MTSWTCFRPETLMEWPSYYYYSIQFFYVCLWSLFHLFSREDSNILFFILLLWNTISFVMTDESLFDFLKNNPIFFALFAVGLVCVFGAIKSIVGSRFQKVSERSVEAPSKSGKKKKSKKQKVISQDRKVMVLSIIKYTDLSTVSLQRDWAIHSRNYLRRL